MKGAIIGERKTVSIFESLGLRAFSAKNNEEFKKIVEEIEKENYAILFICQSIAKANEKEVEKMFQKSLPAVVIVPDVGEKSSQIYLRKILEKALGSEKLWQEK